MGVARTLIAKSGDDLLYALGSRLVDGGDPIWFGVIVSADGTEIDVSNVDDLMTRSMDVWVPVE